MEQILMTNEEIEKQRQIAYEQGRADAIEDIYSAVDSMFCSSDVKALNDLEYGLNQGLERVQDYLEQLKEQKNDYTNKKS